LGKSDVAKNDILLQLEALNGNPGNERSLQKLQSARNTQDDLPQVIPIVTNLLVYLFPTAKGILKLLGHLMTNLIG